MITLIIPAGGQVSRVMQKLVEEYGTSSHIKSRVNRQSVQSAIESAQQKLKLCSKIPKNGLVLFCGTILTDDGKEKKVSIDFEPFTPVNNSVYLCDNCFHVEILTNLLKEMESSQTFGFIILDGNGCLFATVKGSQRTILHQFTVDLPKKHGRGGQSALRFARLRLEKRQNYLRKCTEYATQYFIDPVTHQCSANGGLIIAGSAELKSEFLESKLFDPRLAKAVIKVVDVSYGMEPGFNQAIELSMDCMSASHFIQEKLLLQHYFDQIAQDTGKYCFFIEDTMKALEMSAVETLMVWENLPVHRYVLNNTLTKEETVLYLTPEQEKNDSYFHDVATGVRLEVVERISLVEWLVNNYQRYGAKIAIVSDRTPEGSQFCRGFGGVGGLLRWRVDFLEMEVGTTSEADDDEIDWEGKEAVF